MVETAFSYLNVGNGIGACISSWTPQCAAIKVKEDLAKKVV